MELNNLLGIIVPTNEPEVCFNFLIASLDQAQELKEVATFLFNFQKPWTQDQIDEAIKRVEDQGFKARWKYSEYDIKGKGLIPMNKIRHDACALMPEAKFYAMTDDDMQFKGASPNIHKNGGQQYLECLHYMMTHEKCGMILCGGTMFRTIPKYHIGPVRLDSEYVTGRGYFIRNLSESGDGDILPAEALDLVGASEERLIAGFILSHGYYPAKVGNIRVRHYENHVPRSKVPELKAQGVDLYNYQEGKLVNGNEMYDWANDDIVEANNHGYIRDHYNPKFKGWSFAVCSWENYSEAGGIDVYDEDTVKLYTENYEFSTYEELIKDIREMVG